MSLQLGFSVLWEGAGISALSCRLEIGSCIISRQKRVH
jgi:hypothetical protein